MRRNLQKLSLLSFALLSAAAHAGGTSGMPWETSLDTLTSAVTGPIAKAIGIFSIVGCGFALAFGDASSVTRKAIWVVLGLSIAFSASSFFLTFFGFAGGLTV